jgi:integral membrane protein
VQTARTDVRTASRRLAVVSILETVSFLVLVAMMLAGSDAGVSISGMVHGLLFLLYAGLVVVDREVFGWSWGFVAVAVLTGPVGAIVVLEHLRRRR